MKDKMMKRVLPSVLGVGFFLLFPQVARPDKVDCFDNRVSEECYDRGANGCQAKRIGNTMWIPHPEEPRPAGTTVSDGTCGQKAVPGGGVANCGTMAGRTIDPQQCKQCGRAGK